MKQNILSEKSTKALLNILDATYNGQIKSDPDYLNKIVNELNLRNLSDEERLKFENLKDLSKLDGVGLKNNYVDTDSQSDNYKTQSYADSIKYAELKIFIGILSFLGYAIIIFGIMGFLFFIFNKQGYLGDFKNIAAFSILILSLIIALPILAFSNLINVFIDIETNTRKTYKLLNKILNKK